MLRYSKGFFFSNGLQYWRMLVVVDYFIEIVLDFLEKNANP
jgi:hypothetical protein